MIVDQELDAVIRAGVFRNREHAIHEAIETLFLVRPQLRTEAAVELFRSGERNFIPDPDIIGDVVAPPQARPVPARPAPVPAPIVPPAVGVVASLLLGLVGGLIGGVAALAGWAAATRRRLRQPASAT